MNGLAPLHFGLGTSLGILAAVLVAVGVTGFVLRIVLRSYPPTPRRVIQLATWVLLLSTLAFGWLSVGNPSVSRSWAGDHRGYQAVMIDLNVLPPAAAEEAGDGDGTEDTGVVVRQDREVFLRLGAALQGVFGVSSYITVVGNAVMAAGSLLLVVDLTRLLMLPVASRRRRSGTINGLDPAAGRADPQMTDGELGDAQRTAALAGVAVALLPAMPLWNGLPLREALVILLSLASVDLSVRLARDLRLRWLVANALILAILLRTRWDPVPVLLAAMGVAVLVGAWERPALRRVLTSATGTLAVSSVVLAASSLVAVRGNRAAWWFAERSRSQFEALHRTGSTSVGLEPVDSVARTGGLDLLLRLPGALARGLWSPFPTQFGDVQPALLLDAAVYWLLTPLVVLGLVVAVRARRTTVLVPLTFAIGWLSICGFVLGNYGNVARLRLSGWLVLLPLAAWGLTWLLHLRQWRTEHISTMEVDRSLTSSGRSAPPPADRRRAPREGVGSGVLQDPFEA